MSEPLDLEPIRRRVAAAVMRGLIHGNTERDRQALLAEVDRLRASLGRLLITCARCGDEMLAQFSPTVENEAMEVCSRCEWQMWKEDEAKLRAEVERLRAELARQAEQIARRWLHYTSTYCIHGQHGDCRLSCKVCHSLCRCGCHEAAP